jgi:hypothetical protein
MSADHNVVRDCGMYRRGHALRVTCMTTARNIAAADDIE